MNISSTWVVNPLDFLKVVEQDISVFTLTLAEKIFYGIVDRTPVYTGSLRASWVAGTSESTSIVVGGSPTSVLPPPSFPMSLNVSGYQAIYIMNSTPYAGLVEHGGPKNPPRAMVQNTLNSL